jgi:hypothetical protein
MGNYEGLLKSLVWVRVLLLRSDRQAQDDVSKLSVH